MTVHYDKLTYTMEQVIEDANELDGVIDEDDTFYIIYTDCYELVTRRFK